MVSDVCLCDCFIIIIIIIFIIIIILNFFICYVCYLSLVCFVVWLWTRHFNCVHVSLSECVSVRLSVCLSLSVFFACYVMLPWLANKRTYMCFVQLLNAQTYCNMTSLVPSMEYGVSVEIRPLQGGYWSDAAWHRLTTLPDGRSLKVVRRRLAVTVPTPLGKSWIFFLKIPGPGKSWKITLVLESPGN